MTELDLALIALAAALVSALAASASGTYYVALPAIGRCLAVRALGRDVQRLADEHAARPEPRRRHDAHCPACGRFARLTSSGPRGTWTRCKAHGVRLRPTKRIGKPERRLVTITPYRPLVALPIVEHVPLVPEVEAIRPWRCADWLDGDAPRDDFRRDMMRPLAA